MSAIISSETSVGESMVDRQREESATSGPLPVLGIQVDHQPAKKWLVGVKVHYFDTDYEDYDGSILDAGIYAEYLVGRNWSVGVGYNYFSSMLTSTRMTGTAILNMSIPVSRSTVATGFDRVWN